MVPQKTVFFFSNFVLCNAHPRAYICIINEKTKGKFITYKVKRCIYCHWASGLYLTGSRFQEASIEQMSLSAYVRWVSSAYILDCEFDKQLGKSLIYKRNNKGPSIVPWGIPQVTVQLLERRPLTADFCVLLSKYEESNSRHFHWFDVNLV